MSSKLHSKLFSSVAIAAALGLASVSAQAAFLPFDVDERTVPGNAGGNLRTDVGKFTGSYQEELIINDDGSVELVGVVTWAGLTDVDGAAVSNVIGCDNSATCYDTYAIFEGTGVFNGTTFDISDATLRWLIDPTQDTDITLNAGTHGANLAGGVAPTVSVGGTTADDYDIANATNLAIGIGPDSFPGAYLAVWDDLVLTDLAGTADGKGYFPKPDPFYVLVESTGDVDDAGFGTGQEFSLTGDASAIFRVPEPASIALLGLGLLGFGLKRRRATV